MPLRDYQLQMVAAIKAHWTGGRRRVLGCLPTGGGKTEVAIELMRDIATPTTRALVIVDRKTLIGQWFDRLRRSGVDYIGILQGENTRAVCAPMMIATAQTIRARGVPSDVALITIDESHIWHRTHDDVLEQLGDALVLGLTATPLRDGLGKRFDAMVTGATIGQLIAQDFLVPARYFAPNRDAIETALAGVRIRAGEFALEELARAMSAKSIVGDVVGTWIKRGEDRQSIAFCVDKAHARELSDEFIAAGIAAESVLDETSDEDRIDIFARFTNGTTRILCSVGVLGVGFDVPVASCAILARPTRSLSLHIQQGGRVLRPADGKVDALVLDHAGNTLRHCRLEDFTPPADLSEVDKDTDRATKDAPSQYWVCRHCEAINDRGQNICQECGHARKRATTVVVFDGRLVERQHEPEEVPAGPTIDDVRRFFLMCRSYGAAHSMRDPDGWSYYTTLRRFDLQAKAIPYRWRNLEPIICDQETARWLKSDYQRRLIARAKSDAQMDHAAT